MSDIAQTPPPATRAASPRRNLFWGAAGLAFVSVAIALLAPSAAGAHGLVLLAGVALGALIILAAMVLSGRGLTAIFDTGAGAEEGQTRARLAAALDALPDPVLVTDRSGAPRTCNAAFEALARDAGALGESGRPPAPDRVFGGHPTVSAAVYRLSRAVQRGEALREVLPPAIVGADGRARAFDLEVAPLAGGDAVWRAHERQDDDAVAPSGDSLLDAAPIGFFAAAPDGKIVFMNNTLRDWLGPQAEREDVKLRDLIVGDASRVLGRGGRPGADTVRTDVVLRARDGVETPAVVVTSWPPSDGRPLSRSIVFGLTKTAAPPGVAQAIAGASAGAAGAGAGLLDAMFANAPFGVARLDLTDPLTAVIEDANPALLHLTEGRAAPGSRFGDLFDLSHPDVRAALGEARRGAGAEPVELTLAGVMRQPSGPGEPAPRPHEVQVFFADERGGRMAAYVVDIADHKDVERRLNRSQRLNTIGALVGRVAHDMNNFLSSARIACDLLMESHPVGDPSFPNLQRINQNVTRASGIVRQLRAFAGEESNRPVPLELGETIAECADMIRMAVKENIKVEFAYGREVPTVKADPGQVENLLMNLATNARDAMRESGGGRLSVRVASATDADIDSVHLEPVSPGQYAMIEVSDTGCGMSPETIEKIFEPYFTTKKESEGTGLGLASAFGIVKQSGGHITVASTVGEGSTFKIFLPRHDVTEEERAAMRAAKDEAAMRKPRDLAGRGRILLVEDEDDLRTLSVMALKKRGYEVESACDGEEALELIMERGPDAFDLLITDVVMPEMDGPTLLQKAREHLGEARVIFTSGYAKQEFSQMLSRERDVEFLPKPYRLEDLARKVKEEIGGGS